MDTARRIVERARAVLVDFDGPLARLFPGGGWLEVTDRVKAEAVAAGGPALGELLAAERDHVQCLRIVGEHAPELLDRLEAFTSHLERDSATEVSPRPGALDLVDRTLERGAVLAVVTNNTPEIVATVLDRARPGASDRLQVVGRSRGRVDDLKPQPDLLGRALGLLGARAEEAVFLGDSVTDVQAGAAAGVPVVGVAEDSARRRELRSAGAAAVVEGVADLLPPPQEKTAGDSHTVEDG